MSILEDYGPVLTWEAYDKVKAELAAERARREKAEEVIEYLVNKATSLNDARNESAPYRAQYPRVEQESKP